MQLSLPLSSVKNAWLDSASPIVVRLMRGRDFTADDLHELLPEPAVPNWFGVLLAKMSGRDIGRASAKPPMVAFLAAGGFYETLQTQERTGRGRGRRRGRGRLKSFL